MINRSLNGLSYAWKILIVSIGTSTQTISSIKDAIFGNQSSIPRMKTTKAKLLSTNAVSSSTASPKPWFTKIERLSWPTCLIGTSSFGERFTLINVIRSSMMRTIKKTKRRKVTSKTLKRLKECLSKWRTSSSWLFSKFDRLRDWHRICAWLYLQKSY